MLFGGGNDGECLLQPGQFCLTQPPHALVVVNAVGQRYEQRTGWIGVNLTLPNMDELVINRFNPLPIFPIFVHDGLVVIAMICHLCHCRLRTRHIGQGLVQG